jgi:hypothetical protein
MHTRLTRHLVVLLLPLVLAACGGNGGSEPRDTPVRDTQDRQQESTVPARPGSGTGTATLEWTTPDYRTDGSPLDDLAGFRVYYGPEPGSYPYSVDIPDPDANRYRIEGLPAGTWHFVVVAYDSAGNEGVPSAPESKTIP